MEIGDTLQEVAKRAKEEPKLVSSSEAGDIAPRWCHFAEVVGNMEQLMCQMMSDTEKEQLRGIYRKYFERPGSHGYAWAPEIIKCIDAGNIDESFNFVDTYEEFFTAFTQFLDSLMPEPPLLEVTGKGMLPESFELLSMLNVQPMFVNYPYGAGLDSYSMLSNLPLIAKGQMVEQAKASLLLDRAMGSMCGMGIADSVGHQFEFLDCTDVPGQHRFDLASMTFHNVYNKFGLKYGQWTDDASMGLCMADSLIIRKGFDGSDMRTRFWCWWNCGYNNAFRLDTERENKHSVGLGGNISQGLRAIESLKLGEKPPPEYTAANEDSGNGSIMRFTPISIFYHGAPVPELHDFARRSSFATHPGQAAAEACALLSHIIHCALNSPIKPGDVDPKQFLENATKEYIEISGLMGKSGFPYDEMKQLAIGEPDRATERCWKWRDESLDLAGTLVARGDSYNGYPVSAGYFGSYALDGLAMAMWAVYHTKSFDEAIEKSINLLGDADSHGSVAGQIAGALYGYSTIHPQFLEWLNKYDEHEFAVRGILLAQLGSERSATVFPSAPLFKVRAMNEPSMSPRFIVRAVSGEVLLTLMDAQAFWTCDEVLSRLVLEVGPMRGRAWQLLHQDEVLDISQTLGACGLFVKEAMAAADNVQSEIPATKDIDLTAVVVPNWIKEELAAALQEIRRFTVHPAGFVQMEMRSVLVGEWGDLQKVAGGRGVSLTVQVLCGLCNVEPNSCKKPSEEAGIHDSLAHCVDFNVCMDFIVWTSLCGPALDAFFAESVDFNVLVQALERIDPDQDPRATAAKLAPFIEDKSFDPSVLGLTVFEATMAVALCQKICTWTHVLHRYCRVAVGESA